MKESFILYQDSKEIFDNLSDRQAGLLIKAIFEYEETRIIPKLDKSIKLAFIPIKQNSDRNYQKYLEQCEKNKQNGAKGGRPKKANGFSKNPKNPSGFSENPKNHDNDNEYDNELDNEYMMNDKLNKYITQLNLAEENFPENARNQLIDYKEVIRALCEEETEDFMDCLDLNLLDKCYRKAILAKPNNTIEYFKSVVKNEVENEFNRI